MTDPTTPFDLANRVVQCLADDYARGGSPSIEDVANDITSYREELLKPIEEWWQRYQAVLDEGPMNDLGRILARLREP